MPSDGTDGWSGPIASLDVEVGEPPTDRTVDPRYRRLRLILRQGSRPVGRADLEISDGHVPASSLERAIAAACPPSGWPQAPPATSTRPSVTAAVCTRGRGLSVLQTIASFEEQRYDGPLEIVVVDNAPDDDGLAQLLAARPSRPDRPLRYAVEPRPGLSRARNCALNVATGEYIAFTDDDAIAEPDWIGAIVTGFTADPRVGAVSGLTFAAELETPAQEWYENFDGFNRGRGFERIAFSSEDPGSHPLYPQPTRGAGVNMAFRRELLLQLGGFPPALGAGTGTGGGEDLAMLADVMLAGHLIASEPAAVVRHTHRRSDEELLAMMHAYGVGFTAYLLWCLHRRPRASLGLVRMLPAMLRYLISRGRSHAQDDREVPERFTRELRRGMPEGPAAYIRAVRRDRRT